MCAGRARLPCGVWRSAAAPGAPLDDAARAMNALTHMRLDTRTHMRLLYRMDGDATRQAAGSTEEPAAMLFRGRHNAGSYFVVMHPRVLPRLALA